MRVFRPRCRSLASSGPVRLAVLAFVALPAVLWFANRDTRAAGTVSLTTLGTAYTQDFNTLASSGTANTAVPTGWDFSESGTNANATYRAGTGSDNTGDTYSFGADGQRRACFRRTAQRNPRAAGRRAVHQQHGRHDHLVADRVHRRAVAPWAEHRRPPRRSTRLPAEYERHQPHHGDVDRSRRARLQQSRSLPGRSGPSMGMSLRTARRFRSRLPA